MKPANQLNLFAPPPADPNIDWLVNELDARRRWMTAADLQLRCLGRDGQPMIDDRMIRALAAAAVPKIISGQKGYKHTDHATPEEIHHFFNAMRSQGVKMLKRANEVRKYAHAKIG